MGYRRVVPFSGNPVKARELAQAAFVQSGYRITDVSDSSITAEHAGGFLRTQSSRAIYGASPITVDVGAGQLRVTARYEGIERMRVFLIRLLLGLAVFLGLVLGITFAAVLDEAWPVILGVGLGVGVPLIQLPVHLGVTLRIMRARASLALDTLTDNIVTLS